MFNNKKRPFTPTTLKRERIKEVANFWRKTKWELITITEQIYVNAVTGIKKNI